jgi:hypothetical protein
VFLSHAWKYCFAELLAALESRFNTADAPADADADHAAAPAGACEYLWLGALFATQRAVPARLTPRPRVPDVFVSSQHRTGSLPKEWWGSVFARAIRRINHTVVVLQPWHAPLPLQRSWCLWELSCTLDAGVRLEVLMPPAQVAELHAALDTRFDVASALSQIDTRLAQAGDPEDKEMIDEAVRFSRGGFAAVNGRVSAALREWLLQHAREVAAARTQDHGPTAPATVAAHTNLARLLRLLGHNREAAELCKKLADAAVAAHGQHSAEALAARAALADAQAAFGELHAALRLLRSVARDQAQLHAEQPKHPDVVVSQVAVARALLALCAYSRRHILVDADFLSTPPGDLRRTEPLFAAMRACIRVFKTFPEYMLALVARFDRWLCTQPILRFTPAACYVAFWILLNLAAVCIICVAGFLIIPPVLVIIVLLAPLLHRVDDAVQAFRNEAHLVEALALCTAAHAALLRSTGAEVETQQCAAVLGCALRDGGRLADAVPVLRQAASGLALALGEEHAQALAALADLADALRERGDAGDLEEAETIFRVQAPRLEEQLGQTHPDALCARINVSICMAWRGQPKDAQTMLLDIKRLMPAGEPVPDAPGRLFVATNEALRIYANRAINDREEDMLSYRRDVLVEMRALRRRPVVLRDAAMVLVCSIAGVCLIVAVFVTD